MSVTDWTKPVPLKDFRDDVMAAHVNEIRNAINAIEDGTNPVGGSVSAIIRAALEAGSDPSAENPYLTRNYADARYMGLECITDLDLNSHNIVNLSNIAMAGTIDISGITIAKNIEGNFVFVDASGEYTFKDLGHWVGLATSDLNMNSFAIYDVASLDMGGNNILNTGAIDMTSTSAIDWIGGTTPVLLSSIYSFDGSLTFYDTVAGTKTLAQLAESGGTVIEAAIDTGTFVADSFDLTSGYGCVWNYNIRKTDETALRTGTVRACWNHGGSSIELPSIKYNSGSGYYKATTCALTYSGHDWYELMIFNGCVFIKDSTDLFRVGVPSSSPYPEPQDLFATTDMDINGGSDVDLLLIISSGYYQTLLCSSLNTANIITLLSGVGITPSLTIYSLFTYTSPGYDYEFHYEKITETTANLWGGDGCGGERSTVVVQQYEYDSDATRDIGTVGVDLSVDVNSGNLRLMATGASDGWIFKAVRTVL